MTTFERLVDQLKEDSFFKDFTFRKSDSSFIQKFDGGCRYIELEHWYAAICASVRPLFHVRFDFVHKWFEKFSFRTIQDQRSSDTVGISPSQLGLNDIYDFYPEEKEFKQFNALKETIKICSASLFSKYQTPADVYINDILPRMEGRIAFRRLGADWIFEYLTICKVVAPENYEKLKSQLLKHAEWQMFGNERSEPNMVKYYYRLDEILGYLESLSTQDLMKKRIKK